MIPLLQFFQLVIDLLIWVVIIAAIMSWLVAFNVVNLNNQFVYNVYYSLNRLLEPMLSPIRQILPDLGGIDISPVILILGLIFLKSVVIGGWLIPAFL